MITPSIPSDVCNRLLQGERTAVQCYDRILKRFGSDPRIDPLKFIKTQHEASVQELELIALPADRLSGIGEESWVCSPESADQVTRLFGDVSAIGFLLKGERSLKSFYESAFGEGACRDPLHLTLISFVLLPRSQRHVVALERLNEMFGVRPNLAYMMDPNSVYPWAAAPAHWN